MFKQDGQNQTSCQKPARKTIESSVRFLPDARKHGYVKIAAWAGICLALGLGVSLLSPLFTCLTTFSERPVSVPLSFSRISKAPF
jgi:hypothetical protein